MARSDGRRAAFGNGWPSLIIRAPGASFSYTVALALAGCLTLPGCGSRHIDRLSSELKSGDVQTRRAAAHSLLELGPQAKPALAALEEAIADDDLQVRKFAVRAIGGIGGDARSAMPSLSRALKADDWGLRLTTAYAIQKIDPASSLYREELIAAMKKGEGGVIVAVAALEPPARWAIPTLIALLHDPRPGTRRISADSLGAIESRAAKQRPEPADSPAPNTTTSDISAKPPMATQVENALKDSLSDKDDRVRTSAQAALDAIRKARSL